MVCDAKRKGFASDIYDSHLHNYVIHDSGM